MNRGNSSLRSPSSGSASQAGPEAREGRPAAGRLHGLSWSKRSSLGIMTCFMGIAREMLSNNIRGGRRPIFGRDRTGPQEVQKPRCAPTSWETTVAG